MERFYATLFLVIIGLGAAYMSLSYGIGTAYSPQAGYFPLLLSILLIGLSAVAAIREFADRSNATDLGSWPLRQLGLIIAALIVFAVMIGGGRMLGVPSMGLLPATFFLVLLSSRATSLISLRESLVLALVMAAVSWGIFKELLGLPVPLWPWSY